MPKIPRPLRLGSAALLGFATIALTGSLTSANAATAAPPPAASSLSTLRNSLPATTDPQTGSYSAPSMTVEVALAPQNQAGLNSALQAIYTEGSSQYHQFLSAGQFDAQYAPSAAERASVASYLAGEGLTVASTSSPFLLSVTGSSAKITAAFHTSLSNYVDPRGIRYFQNSRTLQVPTSIVSDIQGVVGLTNTVREHSGVVKPLTGKAAASSAAASASCETGYVTKAQLFAASSTTGPASRTATAAAPAAAASPRRRPTPSTARPPPARRPRARTSTPRSSSCPPTRRRTLTPGRRRSTAPATRRG